MKRSDKINNGGASRFLAAALIIALIVLVVALLVVRGFGQTNYELLVLIVAIVAALICGAFVAYFLMTRKQMRLLSEARAEAEKANKAKGEFLSNMSHDIRTPMNAIVGMTAIATSHMDNRQQLENCLTKISLSSQQLLGLINNIMDISKIEDGKLTLSMSEVSLREVMDAIVSIVRPQVRARNQRFDLFLDNIEHEHVYCDSMRLNQILLNLLSNAVKFTPEEGRIEVRLSEEASQRGKDFTRVHLTVKDNGIGISKEFQRNMYKAFVREESEFVQKTEGSGLGLAITKFIVDAMSGTIELDSAPGKGTCFDVKLDLEIADVAVEDMRLPNWNMLLVDDDEMICTTTEEILTKLGIYARWTLDGNTAVKMASDALKEGKPYDIIMLDRKMPIKDGIQTARELRGILGDEIPILLTSAYDWSDIEEEAVAAGITGFISKPLFRSTLYYGLKRFVEAGGKTGADAEDSSEFIGSSIHFNNVKILLAEDNDLNWEIESELLASLGLDVDHAENGKVCVEMLEKSKPGYYKAILMDIRMPVMSGYEAAELIRTGMHADHDIPIIAMTADAFSEDVKRCLDAGMNAHTPKPINIEEVGKLLSKYIN